MSDWPDGLKVGPIREWPGELTPRNKRQASAFKSTLSATLTLLSREIWNVTDTRSQRESAEMLIAIPAGDGWRIDGKPRANATPEHPGIVFSIESKHGPLSYPCDTFTTWQANLRAVALALEALRKVDRYGVTRHGEQYRGFLALEAGVAGQAGFATAQDALAFLATLVSDEWGHGKVDTRFNNARALLNGAKRRTHPDRGGDADDFSRVMLAESKLRQEGLL